MSVGGHRAHSRLGKHLFSLSAPTLDGPSVEIQRPKVSWLRRRPRVREAWKRLKKRSHLAIALCSAETGKRLNPWGQESLGWDRAWRSPLETSSNADHEFFEFYKLNRKMRTDTEPFALGPEKLNSLADYVAHHISASRYVQPDPVVPWKSCKGHERYAHSNISRLIQRLYADAVHDVADASMSPHSHAYRRKHGTLSAINDVRVQVRDGATYALHLDVKRCFQSINRGLVNVVLQQSSWCGQSFRRLGCWFLEPAVWGPTWQEARQGPRHHLLEGSVIGPVFLNLVLDRVLDEPLDDLGVSFVRYADDILILGESAAAVREGADIAIRLAACANLELRPKSKCVNLSQAPIRFLGTEIHGGWARCANSRLERAINALLNTTPRSGEFTKTSLRIKSLVESDRNPDKRIRYVQRRLLRSPHEHEARVLLSGTMVGTDVIQALCARRSCC